MKNVNVGDSPINDGDTVQVDHSVTTFVVKRIGCPVSRRIVGQEINFRQPFLCQFACDQTITSR